MVLVGVGLRGLPGSGSLAGWLSLPAMRGRGFLADGPRAIPLHLLSASDFADGRDRIRGDSQATTDMVPGHVVCD